MSKSNNSNIEFSFTNVLLILFAVYIFMFYMWYINGGPQKSLNKENVFIEINIDK
jgi:hypothetical protein